jgi:hypothetical protein
VSRYDPEGAAQLLTDLRDLVNRLDAAGTLAESSAHGWGVMSRVEEAEEKVLDAIDTLEDVIKRHAA